MKTIYEVRDGVVFERGLVWEDGDRLRIKIRPRRNPKGYERTVRSTKHRPFTKDKAEAVRIASEQLDRYETRLKNSLNTIARRREALTQYGE